MRKRPALKAEGAWDGCAKTLPAIRGRGGMRSLVDGHPQPHWEAGGACGPAPSTTASSWKQDCPHGEVQPLVGDQGMESLLPQGSHCCLCKVYLTLKLQGLLRDRAQGLEKAKPSACPLLAALQAPSPPISLLHRPLERWEKTNSGHIFGRNSNFFFSLLCKKVI